MARKQLITLLKVLVSGGLLYFVFTKIPLADIVPVLRKAKPFYLLFALLFFIVSKVVAAARLNCYFRQIDIFLTQKSNLKLYLLGMFYNLFLPGGIGGDAYKGYVIKQRFETATKKVVAVLLLDRLSGLLLLLVYACLLAFAMDIPYLTDFKWALLLLPLLAVLVFWGLNKRFFKSTLPVFWPSFGFSALVQLAQLFAVYCILKALAISIHGVAYMFIFLISSIVSVIPLTIGGIGSRELTFLYGADFLGLQEDTSVAISLVFFLITAFVSLFGLVYHFKKPELEVKGK
ncbi:lysylphosphatidylglycerol synthase transmembrane domain-containing protein [Maribacter sp. 2-571]|uniref:lysylphosphatidylglycerol synthase transmembrane domain-containing protein n=1 Tax=Maribacter sp. 2-571 TaxID=3417569 RepID=UPI003D32E6B2